MADITTLTNLRGPAARIVEVSAVDVPPTDPPFVEMTGPDQGRRITFGLRRGLPGVNAVENDEAVATYVGTPGTDTRTALDNRYTGLGALTPAADGTRWVAFGDSLTSRLGNGAPYQGWVDRTGFLSLQQVSALYNAGIVGNNAADMLARIETDVLAFEPSFVSVWVGTNDVTQERSFADYKADVAEIVAILKRAGAAVALFTIPPRADTSKAATITTWNAWLREFARVNACHLVDTYAILVDPATGQFRAGFDSGDGIHIAEAGHQAIATFVQSRLLPRLVLSDTLRPLTNNDPHNLVLNGLLLTNEDGSPSVPDHWLYAGASGGITETLVNDTDFQGGKAWQISVANPTGFRQFLQNVIPDTWVVGDRLLFTCKVKCTAAAGVSTFKGFRLDANFFGAADPNRRVTENMHTPGTIGIVAEEFTVPEGTTGPVQIACMIDVDSNASATFRIGELAVYNLTALGLA